MLTVQKQALGGQLGTPDKFYLPRGAEILRCGIDPATQQPAFWFLADKEALSEEVEQHQLVVVTTGMEVPYGSHHLGMWWAASETFHLFALEKSDPALLVNVLGGDDDPQR